MMKRVLTSLLVCSLALAGAPLAVVAGGVGEVEGSASPVVMSSQGGGGAADERERGRALLRRGKAADALVHLERALKLYEGAGDRAGAASVRDLLGELYERQGLYDRALRSFESAYDIYLQIAAEESRQHQLISALSSQEGAYNANLMLSKIGEVHYRRGDIAKARASFSRMRVTQPETDKLKAAQSGKANVESKGRSIRGIGGRLRGVLGGTPSASTPDQAAGIIADTADTLKAPFNAYRETIIYSTYELGMGRVDFFNDQLESAKKHFENVLSATLGSLPVVGKLGQTRRYRIAARTSLGDVALLQGRYKDAVKLYEEAMKGAREDERLELMWPAQRGLGRTLWAQAALETDARKSARMREEAVGHYRQALSTIETIRRGSLRADEARSTFLATTGEVFDEAASAMAELALRSQTSATAPLEGASLEYAAEALGVVEQGRARSLLDLLSETGAEITEGVPAELLQRKREIQARQEAIAAQLTGVALPGDAPKQSPAELDAELSRLQTEFESVENQIRSQSPRYAALTETRPLTLAEIRERVLDDGTALLEYKLSDEGSYLFALTRDAMTVVRLPARTEIERQVVALRGQIVPASLRRALTEMVAAGAEAQRGLSVTTGGGATATPAAVAEYAKAARALYKSVLEPVAPMVKGSRLLIVGDGALNYVPFAALLTADAPAAGADYSTLPYLLNSNETVFAPSASVIAAIRQQKGSAAGGAGRAGGVLLVADPVFDESDARVKGKGQAAANADVEATRALSVQSALEDVAASEGVAGSSETGRGVLVRLAGTRTEAQRIAQLASTSGRKAETWLDLEASEAKVEGHDLRSYGVVHFATHGLLNTERPQFTGLVLSLVGGGAGDGFLRTDEVFNLRLGSPLVMLSACETGLGREKRGEGVIGLTRAFMYAGAPAVGVSLWSVADQSTAELMTDFYGNLLKGGGVAPGEALRAARKKMVAGKRYSAPFYWAPFVLVGDWR